MVDQKKGLFIELADQVWETPETCYMEVQSAAAHRQMLEAQGFRISDQLAGIPTAMMGEAGQDGPVIAFLGEYDALAGLSQKAGAVEHDPVMPGANGHGCGHNLLGSASLLAATALKDWLEASGLPGRVRYYGCPAEEGGAAKAFMVRSGAFSDVDIAISWHPSNFVGVQRETSLANCRIDFTFTGRAAHAAAVPELGRSALDAVELMNVGVNYMREHMPSDCRIHYAVLDTGGISPNVVQAHAKVRYVVRSPDLSGLLTLVERVKKVAEGAALMTETKMESTILAGVSNLIVNTPLMDAMQGIWESLGAPGFDDADVAFANKIRSTLSADDIAASWSQERLEQRDAPLADFILPAHSEERQMGGSTDVGDVSWVVPTVQAYGATLAIGTQLHTWQVVAQGKSGLAHKGMVSVAKAMAATGLAAITSEQLREAAWADLGRRLKGRSYVSPIPASAEPPISAMTTRYAFGYRRTAVTIQPNSIEARDKAYHLHSYTNARALERDGALVIERGEGIYVYDNTGKRYVEGMAGLWSVGVGFGESRLVEAATKQMAKLPYYHTFAARTHGPSVELAEKLVQMAPVPMSKAYFTNSGSEANDTAMKIVWYRSNALGKPEKKKIISRTKGYHGVTIASASLTGLPNNHRSFDLPLPRVLHTTCPHYRAFKQDGESEAGFVDRCAKDLEDLILKEGPDTVAAFIGEPVMGAGGVIVPPAGYWDAIQKVLKKYDILFIADEVICGFGRTGKMFATETFSLQPDMITLSKQISSSYQPISALLINDNVYQPMADESSRIGTFGHGVTAAGHPVAAAVALENIAIIEERDLVGNVRAVSPRFLERLKAMEGHPLVIEARGIGLLGGLELKPREGFDAGQLGAKLAPLLLEEGVISRAIGDTMAFCPPMIITEAQVDAMFDMVEAGLEKFKQQLAA
eukprot:g18143.t1